jgi:UrcA family protein
MRLSIALLALGLVAAPISAEEVTLRVSYDDAELATDAGYAALIARVAEAADDACGTDVVLSVSPTPRCKVTLVRKVRAELDSRREALTAQP